MTEGTGTNQAGRLYGLSALCPIKLGTPAKRDRSYESLVRGTLAGLAHADASPLAAVPNTYLARFFVLKDVFYESKPGIEEHLKSQYLAFMANVHGDLDAYLRGMWQAVPDDVGNIWQHCVGFEQVTDAAGFVSYIKKCQVTNALLFQGSTDQPLDEQLKGLYLKQEFGNFVAEHQGLSADELRQAFISFVARAEPTNLARPTWKPGATTLNTVVIP